jgi:hypothetical protein
MMSPAAPAAGRRTLLWAVLLALVLLPFAWQHRYDWRKAYGLEPEWIARNLAHGHGFSFRGDQRWLLPPANRNTYSPTAWQEPVNPLLLGAAFRIGGASYYGKLLAVALQALVLFATSVLLYLFGRGLFDEWTGRLASLMLLVQPHVHYLVFGTFMTATLAGFAVLVIAAAFVRCLAGVTPTRALGTGAALGGAMLTSAATAAFFPIGLVLALRGDGSRLAWGKGALYVLGMGLVLSPWVVRNYLLFGGFIPTRSGIGQIVYVGNPVLAETFVPGLRACPSSAGPWWTARSATEAVLHARDEEVWRGSLGNKGYACVEKLNLPGFVGMNEVQRDRIYLREAVGFIKDHPALTIRVTGAKALAYFFTGWPIYLKLITAAAGVGVFLARKRPAVLILAAMIALYAIPYVISLPYHFRYRYPIEPLLVLLAGFCAVTAARWALTLRRRPAGTP